MHMEKCSAMGKAFQPEGTALVKALKSKALAQARDRS